MSSEDYLVAYIRKVKLFDGGSLNLPRILNVNSRKPRRIGEVRNSKLKLELASVSYAFKFLLLDYLKEDSGNGGSAEPNELFLFSKRKDLPPESVLKLSLRVKSIIIKKRNKALALLRRPGSSRDDSVECFVNIKALQVARVGSPGNVATLPLRCEGMLDSDPPVAEIQLSLFFMSSQDLPGKSELLSKGGDGRLSRSITQFSNAHKKMLRDVTAAGATMTTGAFGKSDKTSWSSSVGADDLVKHAGWIDSESDGIATWDTFSRLKISVLRADGLRVADRTTSDPYVLLMFRGEQYKTSVKKKKLDPEWNEAFQFNCLDRLNMEDEVLLVVRDEDRHLSDDDLGQLSIPLWAFLQSTHEGATWYELEPTGKLGWWDPTKSLGRIKLEISLELGREEKCKEDEERNIPYAFKCVAPVNVSPEPPAQSNRPLLYIKAIQARNLNGADSDGLSDPYVSMHLRRGGGNVKGGHGKKLDKQTSTYIPNTLNPRWNHLFLFGEKEYLLDSDIVEIVLYDRDNGFNDDKLGTLSIPVYELVNTVAPQIPTWMTLSSQRYAAAGEIQLLVLHVPAKNSEKEELARKMYRGKEWAYELQLTIHSGRNLKVMDKKKGCSDPYCKISVGGDPKAVTTKYCKDTVNPVWDEKMHFRKSLDPSRNGLGRMDRIRVEVWHEAGRIDKPMGHFDMELGDILDKMDYIDKMGKQLTMEVELDPLDVSAETGPSLDEVDDASSSAYNKFSSSMEDFGSDAGSTQVDSKRFGVGTGGLYLDRFRPPTVNTGFNKALKNMSFSSRESTTSQNGDRMNEEEDDSDDAETITSGLFDTEHEEMSLGLVNVTFRVVPIDELRTEKATKLAVRIGRLEGAIQSSFQRTQGNDDEGGRRTSRVRRSSADTLVTRWDNRIPDRVYAKLELGFEHFESPEVVYHNSFSGVASFHATTVFDHAAQAKVPLQVSICDAATDTVIGRCEICAKTVFDHRQGEKKGQFLSLRLPLDKGLTPLARPLLEIKLKWFDMVQEMKPLIGTFFVRPIKLKVFENDFHKQYRTIFRYKDRTIATRGSHGELAIAFADTHAYTFPVYDMYEQLQIEVYRSRPPRYDKSAYEMPSSPGEDETEREGTSKWGSLYGKIELSPYDMLELEAQIVHTYDRGLTGPTVWPLMKLPLMKGQKERGSLWAEVVYTERIGDMVKPNPNPMNRPEKPFSIANMMKEIHRAQKIAGDLGYLGGGMGHLFEWENMSHTVIGIFLTVIFTCSDFFSARPLALPMYLLLLFMIRKHHARMNGDFVQSVMKEVRDETQARLIFAVVEATGLRILDDTNVLLPEADSSIHIQVPPGQLSKDDELALRRSISQMRSSRTIPLGSPTSSSNGLPPATPAAKSTATTSSRMSRAKVAALGAFSKIGKRISLGRSHKSPESSYRSSMTESFPIVNSINMRRSTGTNNTAVGRASSLSGSPTTLPSVCARLSLREIIGAPHAFKLGSTKSCPPTLSPEFTTTSQGYRIVSSSNKRFESKLIEWEAKGGNRIPAFQVDLNLSHRVELLVLVRVLAAYDVVAADKGGSSDPYVQIVHTSAPPDDQTKKAKAKERHKTKIVPKTLNPIWNQEFVIGSSSRVTPQDTIQLNLFDLDKIKHDPLGYVDIPVSSIKSKFGTKFEPKWLPIKPPRGKKSNIEVDLSKQHPYGQIRVAMYAVEYTKSKTSQNLMEILRASEISTSRAEPTDLVDPSTPSDEPAIATSEGLSTNPDSWHRYPAEIVIDLEDTSGLQPFLGRARLPISCLVHDEAAVKQPVTDLWLSLAPRLDGSPNDELLGLHAHGQVHIRAQLFLPDPKAKQRRLDLDAAKKQNATGFFSIQRYTKELQGAQNQLFHMNNKMERTKNLFNWSHPRKTQFFFKVICFICVLFSIVPSRYILLFIMLFMFTERFRPMGTISLRLANVLAQTATHEDIKNACSSAIISAKSKVPTIPNSQTEESLSFTEMDDIVCLSNQTYSCEKLHLPTTAAMSSYNPRASSLSSIEFAAEDLEHGFSGQVRIILTKSSHVFSSKPRWVSVYAFFLHDEFDINCYFTWWDSRDSFETLVQPQGCFDNIVAVRLQVETDLLLGCTNPDLAFALVRKTPNETLEKVIVLTNSKEKRDKWVHNILKGMVAARGSLLHPQIGN